MKGNNCLWRMSFFVFLFTASLCHAADEAMVLNVSGKAVCEGKIKKEIALADILYEGDTVTLESDCILKLNYFSTGVQEELAGNGTITVGEKGSQKVKGSLSIKSQTVFSFGDGKVPVRNADLQRIGGEVLRGDEDGAKTGSEIRILRLEDTAVRNNTPEFKWKAVKDVNKYVVKISDLDKEYLDTETVLPCYKADSSIGLKPGKSYHWSVWAASDENTGSEAKGSFDILSEKQAGEVAQWESALRKNHAEDSPELLLSLALLYHKYYLNDDAADMLSRLSKKYPDNETFRKWRHLLPGYSLP